MTEFLYECELDFSSCGPGSHQDHMGKQAYYVFYTCSGNPARMLNYPLIHAVTTAASRRVHQ